MASPDYLVLDVDRVLNESEPGRAGLDSLRALFRRADAEGQKLKADLQKAAGPEARRAAEAALTQHRVAVEREVSGRRGALRKALVDLAAKVARDLAAERGVELVLERRAVVVFAPERDVTDEVIARVDATGLSRRKST